MVSVQIAKNQGLTQALKSYAQNNGYDVSNINKQDWNNTVSRLETIQKSREKNKEKSIFTNDPTKKGWHGKMVVQEGTVEFSDAEIQSLLSSMGLQSNAQAYEKWNNAVSLKADAKHGNFQLKNDNSKDEKSYNNDLRKLSEDYIKLYDTDNDGKITYDEFEKYEEQNVRDNEKNIDEKALNAAKASLKTIFNHLNVDNDGNSKDKLDKEEFMNFFFSMDCLDADDLLADGYVSQKSYINMNNALADNTTDSNSESNKIVNFLKRNYNKYFQKLK